jgi:hypothetical protein
MKHVKKLVIRHCCPDKAANYYMWGFIACAAAWLVRWMIIFTIAGRVIEKGDDIFDIGEKAWAIVTHSQSIAYVVLFAVVHTALGAVKWGGLAYGVVGLAHRRKTANT